MVFAIFIVGIDVAKRSHTVRVINDQGQTVYKPFPIRNNCSGCNALPERLRKFTNHKGEFIFAMESTAHYWLALHTRLRKEGYQLVVLNLVQTDAMREMLLQEAKTDEIDTLVIAETIRFGQYKASSVPQENLLALRKLCRNRFYLIDTGSDLKQKITTLLDRVFPEFKKSSEAEITFIGKQLRTLWHVAHDPVETLLDKTELAAPHFPTDILRGIPFMPVVDRLMLAELTGIFDVYDLA